MPEARVGFSFCRFLLRGGATLLIIFLCLAFCFGNELEKELNKPSGKKIPSTIMDADENLVNTKNISVREKDGTLYSDELEVIDLFDKSTAEEKIDYSHCADYYKKASIHIGGSTYAIALKGGAIVGYSPSRPRSKNIQRYDPFTGLFLAKGSTELSYELADIDEYALTKELASTGLKGAIPGNFKSHQNGFLQYAKFSVPTQRNGVISNICYRIYGLGVGGNGFIEKRYIDRFLENKHPYYGDIGVRFEVLDSSKATFAVKFADPFFANNPFKRGDVLVSINDKAPKDRGDLEFMIANLPIGKPASVKVRRPPGMDMHKFEVIVDKRFGGFLLSDSFLERFRLVISRDFVVQKAPATGAFSKLRPGDKILFVNDVDLKDLRPRSTGELNGVLRELFTVIQGQQVDMLEKMREDEERKKRVKESSKDILEQFQSKEEPSENTSLFHKDMLRDMDSFMGTEVVNRETPSMDSKAKSLESFSGDEILRDLGTKSVKTIYDLQTTQSPKEKGDKIKEYDFLAEPKRGIDFLINRDGFEFRVPLE